MLVIMSMLMTLLSSARIIAQNTEIYSCFSRLYPYNVQKEDCSSNIELVPSLEFAEYKSPFNGEYILLKSIDFSTGVSAVKVKAANQSGKADLEFRVGSPDGTKIATVTVESTGSATNYLNFGSEVTQNVSGINDLYIVMANEDLEKSTAFRLSSVEFTPTELNDARIKSISVNGESVSDFDPYTFEYNIPLKKSITEIPITEVETANDSAQYEIINAEELPGSTTIEVTSPDATAVLTYKINFTKQDNDFILNYDFGPSSKEASQGYFRTSETELYSSFKGYGFQNIVSTSGSTADLVSRDRGSVNADSRLNTCVVGLNAQSMEFRVDMPNGRYLFSMSAGDAQYASSCGVSVNGKKLADVTELEKNKYLTITTQPVEVTDGSLVISLTRGKSNISINYMNISTANRSVLYDLKLDGKTLTGFSPQIMDYEVNVRGNAAIPIVSAVPMYDDAQISIKQAESLPGTATVTVTGSDDTVTVYNVKMKVFEATDVNIKLGEASTPLPLEYIGMNINYGSFFFDGNVGTKYLTDSFANMGRYFIRFEFYNDTEYGDGVTDKESFEAAKAAVLADPFNNKYINWKSVEGELLTEMPINPNDSLGRVFSELRRAGIEPLINIRPDGMNMPAIPSSGDYAGLWEWWERCFMESYLCSKNYGIKEYNLFNEPQYISGGTDAMKFKDAQIAGAEAIRAGAELAGVEAKIWGPSLLHDPKPSNWRIKYMQEMDEYIDVFDFHSYKNDETASKYMDDAIDTVTRYNSDGIVEPISISEYNYQFSSATIGHHDKMSNVLNTSRLFNMYVNKGAYAPIHFNMFRRYNRWGNATINCTDATAQTFDATKMHYAYRILGRAYTGEKNRLDYSISGDTASLVTAVTEDENNIYILIMNEDTIATHNYNIDLSDTGIINTKASLREVSDYESDRCTNIFDVTDSNLIIKDLQPQAINLITIAKNSEPPKSTKIYSTKTNSDSIEIIWNNVEESVSFDIERKELGSDFVTIEKGYKDSYYTDSTVESGKKYIYRIKVNGINDSVYSPESGELGILDELEYVMPYVKTCDPEYGGNDFEVISGSWEQKNYRVNETTGEGEDKMLLTSPGMGNTSLIVTGPSGNELENWKDYTMFAGFYIENIGTEGEFGLVARYTDEDNYYRFIFDPNENTVSIIKKQNGQDTVLICEEIGKLVNGSNDNKANKPANGENFLTKISVNGNRLDFYLRGNLSIPQIVTAYDSDPLPYGKIGFVVSEDAAIALDDVGAYPLLTDDFEDGSKSDRWNVESGNWTMANGVYSCSGNEECIATAGSEKSRDYIVEAEFSVNAWKDENAEVVLCSLYRDADNNIKYSVNKDGKLSIIKTVNGESEIIDSVLTGVPVEGVHTLRAQIEKEEHRVYLDGELLITRTINIPELQYGKAAIGTSGAEAEFKSFNLNGFLYKRDVVDTSISVTDADGKTITSLSDTDTILVNTQSTEQGKVYIALYNNEKELVSVTAADSVMEDGHFKCIEEMKLPAEKDGMTAKIFLWNNSNKPLIDTVIIK